jgi:uncharacterized membrane protein
MRVLPQMLGRIDEPQPKDGVARVDHSGVAAARLVLSGLVGLGVTVGLVSAGAYWAVGAAAGWDAAALTFLAVVWFAIYPKDADETRMLARAEDFSRATADIVLLSASVASLAAVAFVLVKAGNSASDRWMLIALAVATVALAWASVHTVYVLRYAGLFYEPHDPPIVVIDFNDESYRPDYHDFAYLAVTIGMTYQVSDTTLKTQAIRRAALRHALLSYVFGTVIVAVTINVVASLLNK